ncbi:ribosome modulation factor [Methylobacterium sp. ID0610]|uniref:ribosome modulation factor n=1 Tax=Methylobacterium carpenticola TaxID=3344827 RepID=UPI003698DFAF
MAVSDPPQPADDPAAQGVRARQNGKPRDVCPYPLDTEEREQWLEGYDGRERTAPPAQPMKPT